MAIVVAVVLVVGTGVWLFVGREGSTPTDTGVVTGPVAMDEPLPTIDGRSLSGEDLSTDRLRGKVGVLNVWATWCGPCRREQPGLQRLADHYGARVRFMGINYQDDRIAAARWAEDEFRVTYPSLYDPNGKTASQLGYPYLPDTYVIDRSGTIRWAIQGETNETGAAGADRSTAGGAVAFSVTGAAARRQRRLRRARQGTRSRT